MSTSGGGLGVLVLSSRSVLAYSYSKAGGNLLGFGLSISFATGSLVGFGGWSVYFACIFLSGEFDFYSGSEQLVVEEVL